MAKKVVDSEILIQEIQNMQGRVFAPTQYMGSTYVDPNNLQGTLGVLGNTINQNIAQSINQTMSIFLNSLITAIRLAERDEHDGMCGLCRTPPDFIGDQNV